MAIPESKHRTPKKPIVLRCYVPNCDDGRKIYDHRNICIGDDFTFTHRQFDLLELSVSEIKKYAHGWWNPIWVRAVFIITSKDPTPFFIKEEDVENTIRSIIEAKYGTL